MPERLDVAGQMFDREQFEGSGHPLPLRAEMERDGQWARAKGMDTFCPLGPWIETELDPQAVDIVTTRDGEVFQDGHSSDMVHGVAALISYASKAFTLLPGDVILTGTPAGVGPVVAGQRVEIEIDAIGTLSNPFVAAER